jgi:membrane protease YdiL (CAAX protease family)
MIFTRADSEAEAAKSLRTELIVPWWEVLGVSLIMLGCGILFSAYFGLTHASGSFYLLFSDHVFLLNGAFESAMLACFLYFLHRRGWKPSDFRIRLGWITTVQGLELLVFTYGGFWLVSIFSRFMLWAMGPTPYAFLAALFVPEHIPIPKGGFHLHWSILVVAMVLNAYYEEIVYMGYGFNQWAAKYGARTAVLFSVLARLAIHTYQGTEHLLPIGVWAVIFGVWYRYRRKLWPLILAHALVDLVSFGELKALYGAR